jgi:uncharacterized protein
MVQRHIPERTCVGCREARPKRTLVRIVRSPEGSVLVDDTGKRFGRGAYLCRTSECWQKGLRKETLARALKTTIGAADRAALEHYATSLTAERPGEVRALAGGSVL